MKNQSLLKNNICERKPNKLLRVVFNKIPAESEFLDLGCGRGWDSLFMLTEGFSVTAVDSSEEFIKQIANCIETKNLPRDKINLVCKDMRDFEIADNKYAVINAFNFLQFLPQKDALLLIDRIKNGLKIGGYAVISGFTTGDSLYKKSQPDRRCFFAHGELKNLFSDFAVILYKETIIADQGHPGEPLPHEHHVVRLIAKKN